VETLREGRFNSRKKGGTLWLSSSGMNTLSTHFIGSIKVVPWVFGNIKQSGLILSLVQIIGKIPMVKNWKLISG